MLAIFNTIQFINYLLIIANNKIYILASVVTLCLFKLPHYLTIRCITRNPILGFPTMSDTGHARLAVLKWFCLALSIDFSILCKFWSLFAEKDRWSASLCIDIARLRGAKWAPSVIQLVYHFHFHIVCVCGCVCGCGFD